MKFRHRASFALLTTAAIVGVTASSALACSSSTTVVMDSKAKHFKVFYRDAMINTTGRAANLSCTANTSGSITFTVSASAKTAANAIFAKFEASVGVSLATTVTSGFATTGSISVPAHTTTNCDRGIYWYSGTGHTSKLYNDCSSSTSSWKTKAPWKPAWKFSDE